MNASASAVEVQGASFIPDEQRSGRPRDLFFMFLSANVTQLYVVIGATIMLFGLEVWQAVVVILLSNTLMFLMGWFATLGAAAGVPTSIITRAIFGLRGNRIFGAGVVVVLSAMVTTVNLVIGTQGGLVIAERLGIAQGPATTAVVCGLIVLTSVGLAIYGYNMMVRTSGVLTIIIAAAFVLLAFFVVQKVDLAAFVPVPTDQPVIGFIIALTLCIAMPLSWGSAADFARQIPSTARRTPIVLAVGLGGMIPLVGLELIGVLAATATDMTDPIAGLVGLVPDWFGTVLVVVIVIGSIMNTVMTIYGGSFGIQAAGVPVNRVTAVIALGLTAAAATVYVLFLADDFLGILQLGLTCLGSIAAPLTAILLIDSIRRRGRYDGRALSVTSPDSPFWYRGGFRISGIVALLVGSVIALLSLNGASYQGPISRWLGGVDMSILFGGLVTAVLFVILSRVLDRPALTSADLPILSTERTMP